MKFGACQMLLKPFKSPANQQFEFYYVFSAKHQELTSVAGDGKWSTSFWSNRMVFENIECLNLWSYLAIYLLKLSRFGRREINCQFDVNMLNIFKKECTADGLYSIIICSTQFLARS